MEKILNIAYLGFGKSTKRYHIPFVRTRKNLRITRIVDGFLPDEKSAEQVELEQAGTIFSKDLADIKNASDVDLVLIVTPPHTHFALAKELLEAGKNVMVEKPATSTVEELDELVSLAKERKLFFSSYQNRRFDSDFLTVKKVIERGYLGRLIDITATMDDFRPDDEQHDGPRVNGEWYGLGVHMTDQIISLFGKPERANYDLRSVRNPASSLDDYFSVDLLYPDFRVTLQASEIAAVLRPKWTLYGTSGSFVKYDIDQQENDLKLGIMPGEPEFGEDAPQAYGKLVYFNQNGDRIEKYIPSEKGDYARAYDAAYETIVKGAPQNVSHEEMRAVIEILNACE